MKKTVILSGLIFAGTASAAGIQTLQYDLPDTGLAPSFGEITYISRMRERHGGSHLSMQRYELTIPLSDPRKTRWNDININAQLDTEITVFNAGGSLTLKNEVMYNIALPISFIKSLPNGNNFIAGFASNLSTDGHAIEHGIDVSAYAMYTMKKSDTLSFTIGAGVSPRFAKYIVGPIFGFEWKPNRDWTIDMSGYHLSALYKVNERLRVGPFATAEGGNWAVETPTGDKYFRLNALILGLTGEYNFAEAGQSKRIFNLSVGSNVATRADFMKRNAGKDSVQTHHYKPALYVSAEVDFRF